MILREWRKNNETNNTKYVDLAVAVVVDDDGGEKDDDDKDDVVVTDVQVIISTAL